MNFFNNLELNARKDGIDKIVVGAIITNKNGDVFIAKRKKNNFMGGYYEIPGGNAELGETIYDALVRDKPVVTLGYSWAKGKGINYEAWKAADIEKQIKKAIDFGFTDKMKQAFIKHLAQCLKYYLYDNGLDRPVRYGQMFPDSFDGFYELYYKIGNED